VVSGSGVVSGFSVVSGFGVVRDRPLEWRCVSPRKVLEMYSETWFPERLIFDKWDSSLFSILLNYGRNKHKKQVALVVI